MINYERSPGAIEQPNDNPWVSLKDMPPIDFWVGSEYQGAYHQRLQINLPALHEICHDSNLPPLILKSDIWNPPTVQSPEMIAPGLSILKKAALERYSTVPESDGEYFTLTAIEDIRAGDEMNTPVGWRIKIKDRKILHDFSVLHPRIPDEMTEKHFLEKMNEGLRQSLIQIAIQEVKGSRILDKKSRDIFIRGNLGWQVWSWFTPTVLTHSSLLGFTVLHAPFTAVTQNIYKSLCFAAIALDTKRKEREMYERMDGPHNSATYLWRKNNFPNYPENAYRKPENIGSFGRGLLPLDILIDPLYKTIFALNKQKTPLFRLTGK